MKFNWHFAWIFYCLWFIWVACVLWFLLQRFQDGHAVHWSVCGAVPQRQRKEGHERERGRGETHLRLPVWRPALPIRWADQLNNYVFEKIDCRQWACDVEFFMVVKSVHIIFGELISFLMSILNSSPRFSLDWKIGMKEKKNSEYSCTQATSQA